MTNLEAPRARVDHFANLARQCRDLEEARQLHSWIIASGEAFQRDRYLSNVLIEMFGRCGSVEDARRVFRRIDLPNAFSWNLMLAAYAHSGHLGETRKFFDLMPQRDVVSWNSMLSAYVRHGSREQCLEMFAKAPKRNAVSWASIVSMLVKNGHFPEAAEWFLGMDLEGVRPSARCLVSIADACVALGDRKLGELIYQEALASGFAANNVVVSTALIKMYGEFRNLDRATEIFGRMQVANVVAMTSLIVAYAKNGFINQARDLFTRIKKPDVVAWTSIITAYGDVGNTVEAKSIFDEMPVKNVVSYNALMTAYSQNGYLVQARNVFDLMDQRDKSSWTIMLTSYTKIVFLQEALDIFSRMPKNNVAAWNSLMAAYVQSGYSEFAIDLFKTMLFEGIPCNEITFVIVLDACAMIPDLKLGRKLHEMVLSLGLEKRSTIGTSLIDMYRKCGSLDEAWDAFRMVSSPDVICWTSIILAYAHSGHGQLPLELFWLMCNDGVGPSEVTLAGVLCACCHAGKVEESESYFQSINQDFGLVPITDHYVCMVDILGKSGKLDNAEEMIKLAGLESETILWTTLLASCKLHNDTDRARRIAEMVFRTESREQSPYVLVANIHTAKNEALAY